MIFFFKFEIRFAWKIFTSDEKVISAVLNYFMYKSLEYFFSSIEKLIFIL